MHDLVETSDGPDTCGTSAIHIDNRETASRATAGHQPALRRGRGDGSLTQLRNGRWMGRATVSPGVRRTVYGDTKADAQRLMRQASLRAERGEPQPDHRVTVETFLSEWLETTARRTVRSSTFVSYDHYVRRHLVPELGRIRLARLTLEDVDKFLAKKTAEGLSPRTCQYMRSILRSALGWAVKRGRLARNAAALSDPPRVERRPLTPLTPEEAQRLVTAAPGHRLGALFVLALDTGARQGELLGLRWADVDLKACVVRIVRTKHHLNGVTTFDEPKSATSRRTVAFTSTTGRMFRRHRARQLKEKLRAGSKWQSNDLVFTTSTGLPLHASTVTHQFQAFLSGLGIRQQRFHDLRHASTSFLLAQGVPIKVIAERLGHSQISLTLSTYAHLSQELQGEAVARMNSVLSGGRRG